MKNIFRNYINKIFLFSIFLNLFNLNLTSAQSNTSLPPPQSNFKELPLPDFKDIGGLITNFNDNIVQNLVILLSGVAVVLFLYGLVRFILHRSQGTESKSLEADKQNMLWGLGALFVLVSLWGIITLAQELIGVEKNNNIQIPKICVNDKCDNQASIIPGQNGITGGGATASCPAGYKFDEQTTSCLPILDNGGGATASYSGNYNQNSILNWNLPMKSGDEGESVVELQKFLKDNGSPTLVMDGKFGPATISALKSFQTKSKLVADGMVGAATRAVIAYRYVGENEIYGDWPDLAYGSRGEEVSELQSLLNRRNCFTNNSNNSEDGIFGIATKAAVDNFQKRNALKEDNIVGPSTRAVLIASDTNNC